jgi:hypothetical protein
MITFKEVVHYSASDTDFCGDFRRIEIFKDDELVAEYGDHYHDKGRDKAEGLFDGIMILLGGTDDGKWSYDYIEVADEE